MMTSMNPKKPPQLRSDGAQLAPGGRDVTAQLLHQALEDSLTFGMADTPAEKAVVRALPKRKPR